LPNAAGKATTMLDLGQWTATEEHLSQFVVHKFGADRAISDIPHNGVACSAIAEEYRWRRHDQRPAVCWAVPDLETSILWKMLKVTTFWHTRLSWCFVGNVALKSSVSARPHMIGDYIKAEFSRNFRPKMAALVAHPAVCL
jgi:fatty acid/phospholipid biosynthesis enzyme